jgi:hypothetical protein
MVNLMVRAVTGFKTLVIFLNGSIKFNSNAADYVLKSPCWYLGQNTGILTPVSQGFLLPSSRTVGLCLKLAFNTSF